MTAIKRLLQTLRQRLAEHRNADRMDRKACQDFGVTRAEMDQALAMRIDVPDRMGRMSAVFGAAEAVAGTDRWQLLDMARLCNRCGHRPACARALDAPGGPAPQDMEFCPNAASYRDLAARDAA